MLCEVAALPFKAHANYGTWSINFDIHNLNPSDIVHRFFGNVLTKEILQ